jgi:hypothetical protein
MTRRPLGGAPCYNGPMSRRRPLLFTVFVVLALFGVGVWVYVEANARRIRPGMTRGDVEATLGAPDQVIHSWANPEMLHTLFWESQPGLAVVCDDDGRVTHVDEPGLLDQLHGRLHRWFGL